jgi:hypothetical protein
MGFLSWLFGNKEPKEQRRPKETTTKQGWKSGDRVLAPWIDAYFYAGSIRRMEGASCEIVFDDGEVAWVESANLRRPDIVKGSQVFCRFHAGPYYMPGKVRQQNGEKIQVEYDNGEKEWTTISMVRVTRPLVNSADPPARVHQNLAMPMGPGMAGPGAIGPGVGGPMTGTMAAAGPMVGQPSAPFIPDLGDPVTDCDWRTGDRVLGRWFDLFWYPATILAMGTKGYHLLFDDGDQRVVKDLGLMPMVVEEGEELFIRPKNQPQRIYTPAKVLRVKGETIDVELEDGTHEANTKVSRARLWRCPVGIGALSVEEGDRAWAQDIDGFTYPAEILSVEEDKIIVSFLDGPERMLTPELVRPFELRSGTAVQCRWKGGQAYFPGKITQIEGDRVHVAYDDGDREWTTVRLIRLVPAEGAK